MNSKARILIVDDDVDIQRLLATRLKKTGYEILTATDGVGCMQQARRNDPDLVVLDLGIPGGDGFTSLQRLRSSASFAATPVVVLTGNDDPAAEQRARKLGASEFVNKSDGTDPLLRAIEQCLDDEAPPTSATANHEIELTVVAESN